MRQNTKRKVKKVKNKENQSEKHWYFQIDKVFLIGLIFLVILFLVVVHKGDRKDIAGLADETLGFLESVCQRYDNYAEGQKSATLKDIYDKTRGLLGFASTEMLENKKFLMEFIKNQELSGVLVLDKELNLVSEADSDGKDAYKLWKDFFSVENKKDIIQYKNKMFSGTVMQGEISYDVVVVSRQDTDGLILCYENHEKPIVDDSYEPLLEDTLTNNTFHKNPKIVITDGEKILATNTTLKQGEKVEKAGLITDTSSERWKDGNLIHLKWKNQSWYGKRAVYGKYFIYVFYPASEVFTNMLPIATTAIAFYALLSMLAMFLRNHSERKHWKNEKKQLNTIKAVSSLYVTSSILHIKKGSIEGIVSTKRAQSILDETTEAVAVSVKLAERIIAPEFQKAYIEFLDFSTMDERMGDRKWLTNVFQDQNGTWFSTYLIPMEYDENHKLKDVLFLSRDINDYKQKEEANRAKLEHLVRDAKMANEVKSSFLRRMSHDIQTPVNGIRGMAMMAEKSLEQPEQAKEYIEKIIRSSEYLEMLLDDVLQMSKLESGSISFEEKPFDLGEVIKNTAEFIEERAKEKEVRFELKNSDISHEHVIGSPLHVRQVMQNVMSNAVKFTNPGGKVEISCQEKILKEDRMILEFICQDTGIGMSEKFQPKIFELFSQEKDSARTAYEGNGLGLPIVKDILDKCGGTITVESKKGKGSVFKMEIPLKIDVSFEKKEENTFIGGVKVLLVEDNEMNMEIAEYLLKEQGAEITKAYDGEEAVQIFKESEKGTFDLILMDIMMPKMNGLEATRTIRRFEREDAKIIPIFAMTANSFVEDRKKSKEAGMNEHLSKPLDMKKVVEVIAKYYKK